LEVKGHADIRKDANFTDCYFDEYSSADLLCVEASITCRRQALHCAPTAFFRRQY